MKLSRNPTEYLNIFGVTFRYLRYLKVRQRIKATSTSQYGRLAEQDLPRGELAARADLERRQTFLRWLQDPDRVVYDDGLARAWKNYQEKKLSVHDERGRIAQFLFGEPKKNFEDARQQLLGAVGIFLYNRWKSDAAGNLRALIRLLSQPDDVRQPLRGSDLANPRALATALSGDAQLLPLLRERFTHDRAQSGHHGRCAARSARRQRGRADRSRLRQRRFLHRGQPGAAAGTVPRTDRARARCGAHAPAQ
jgi:hypothetical protein